MLTPAIRAILYPSSAPQGANRPISSLKSPVPNEKPTRARMRRRTTGGSGWSADRIRCSKSSAALCANAGKRIHQIFALACSQGAARAHRDRRRHRALPHQHRDDPRLDQPLHEATRTNDWIARILSSAASRSPSTFLRFLPAQPRHREVVLVYGLLNEKLWAYPAASSCSARSSPTSSTATASPTSSP